MTKLKQQLITTDAGEEVISQVIDLFAPALLNERREHEQTHNELDTAYESLAVIGKELDDIKSKKGGKPTIDLDILTKQYASVLFEKVKSKLDNETIEAARKYHRK